MNNINNMIIQRYCKSSTESKVNLCLRKQQMWTADKQTACCSLGMPTTGAGNAVHCKFSWPHCWPKLQQWDNGCSKSPIEYKKRTKNWGIKNCWCFYFDVFILIFELCMKELASVCLQDENLAKYLELDANYYVLDSSRSR